jgi:hypothetical protein
MRSALSCANFIAFTSTPMPKPDAEEQQIERELTIQLYTQMFALGGAMVGVCLTVIGVLRLIIEVKGYRTMADDLVAIDGILFLLTCVFSFLTLKATSPTRRKTFQRVTDTVFLGAITLMMVICALITWAFAHIGKG